MLDHCGFVGHCVKGQDQVRTRLSQVSGRTVGSISRLPLLHTISGRPSYLLNRVPLTRPTCARTLESDVQKS